MAIKAEDFRWSATSEGEWLYIKYSNPKALLATLEPGKTYDIEIKRHRKKRSLSANGYAWVLLDKLAAKIGIPKGEIYREYIKDVGGNSTTGCYQDGDIDGIIKAWEQNGMGWVVDTMPSKLPGCTNVILYKGSSEFDTAQMARLLDLIIFDCKEQGIETMPEAELGSLLGRWGA